MSIPSGRLKIYKDLILSKGRMAAEQQSRIAKE